MKQKINHLAKDIRFWLLLFFVIRLIGITNPPLEIAHNWRQTTVTMVARNFLEVNSNIFYPRIDIAGEKTGITGMEFPLLNYLIFLLSKIFGYTHWYGRLINLIVSTIGVYFFYKLIAKYFSPSLAFKAAFILIFSVWFNYSRKIMPDTFSVSLVLIGIYYGAEFLLNKSSIKNLILYFVFITLGILSKMPAAYLALLLLIPTFNKKIAVKPKIRLGIFTAISATCCALYYFYWVPHLTKTFGFAHFFMGKSISDGARDIVTHLDQAFEKFYLEALQIIGFVFCIVGICIAAVKKEKLLFIVFGGLSSVFLVFMLKAGFAFYHHSYYIIPFAPVMALMAAYSIEQIKYERVAWFLLFLIASENILNKFNDYFIKPENVAILSLEKDINAVADSQALIAINSGNVPSPMYFAHRKGWVTSNQVLQDSAQVQQLQRKGLRYIVILKKTFGKEIILNYKKALDSPIYCIYKL